MRMCVCAHAQRIASLCRFHYHSHCEVVQQRSSKEKQASSTNQKEPGSGGREGGREGETHPFIFHVSIYSGSWRQVKQDGREEGKRR